MGTHSPQISTEAFFSRISFTDDIPCSFFTSPPGNEALKASIFTGTIFASGLFFHILIFVSHRKYQSYKYERNTAAKSVTSLPSKVVVGKATTWIFPPLFPTFLLYQFTHQQSCMSTFFNTTTSRGLPLEKSFFLGSNPYWQRCISICFSFAYREMSICNQICIYLISNAGLYFLLYILICIYMCICLTNIK